MPYNTIMSQIFLEISSICISCDNCHLVCPENAVITNGSDYAIEALTSLDGRILGKMGHSERMGQDLYKNILGDKQQDIFINGVNYFK